MLYKTITCMMYAARVAKNYTLFAYHGDDMLSCYWKPGNVSPTFRINADTVSVKEAIKFLKQVEDNENE